ncbi:MAG: hypothetical protein ABEJ42_07765 [Halobacteriaceae archaeon]
MSGGDRLIVCRRCGEVVSTDLEGCPHCGASVQGIKIPLGSAVFGLVIMGASAMKFNKLLPYFALGLLLFIGGAYFLYDRYQRRSEARKRTGDV